MIFPCILVVHSIYLALHLIPNKNTMKKLCRYPGYQRIFLARRCHEKKKRLNRNRKPRMNSLWQPEYYTVYSKDLIQPQFISYFSRPRVYLSPILVKQ